MRHASSRKNIALCLAATFLLASCVTPASKKREAALPLLSPATLGRTLHAVQLLTAEHDGQSWTLQVALEVTPNELRLAGLNPLGQRVITLRWDGATLAEERDARLPEQVQGERILSDLQLIYWPRAALAATLPGGWTIEEQAGERIVRQNQQAYARIRCDDADPWQGHCVFEQQRYGYRLTIDSTLVP